MKTTTFLTFVGEGCGKAEDAINFYTSIFPNSEIKNIVKYKDGEEGGTVELIKYGVFTLNGVEYIASENNYNHNWSFTPGVSIFVSCSTENEIQNLFDKLLENDGQVMVPLNNYQGKGDYGFGKMFGWVQDKYGISWQLNLL